MNKVLRITGMLAVLVLIVGLLGAAVAFAQDSEGESTPEDGIFGFGRRGLHFGRGPGVGLVDPAEMHAAIASTLNMSVDELEAALAEGTPLVVLAEQQGVEIEVVREAMEAVRVAAINEAVAAGTITQEQADWMLERAGAPGPCRQGQGAAGLGPGFGGFGPRSGGMQNGGRFDDPGSGGPFGGPRGGGQRFGNQSS
jgi:hypothetical protein